MSEATQNGPGAELKAAREGMDVSTREVADALNLPVNVIEALEADDFERLPPTVFTRGYLRSYARLLELSPESLLARYPEVTEEVDAITGEMAAVEPAGLPPTRMLAIAGAVGVVLIALLVLLLGDDESVDVDQPAALEVVENESAPEESPVATDTTAVVETAVVETSVVETSVVDKMAQDAETETSGRPATDEAPQAVELGDQNQAQNGKRDRHHGSEL